MKRALQFLASIAVCRFTLSFHGSFRAGPRANRRGRDNRVAYGEDWRRQAPLPDGRPRHTAHPAARLCGDLADVAADYARPAPSASP